MSPGEEKKPVFVVGDVVELNSGGILRNYGDTPVIPLLRPPFEADIARRGNTPRACQRNMRNAVRPL